MGHDSQLLLTRCDLCDLQLGAGLHCPRCESFRATESELQSMNYDADAFGYPNPDRGYET